MDLTLLETAKVISNLKFQVPYDLYGGVKHVVDFEYEEDGQLCVEDFKGAVKQEWKNKRKMFLTKYPEIKYVVSNAGNLRSR